jgi:cell division protease FtsH
LAEVSSVQYHFLTKPQPPHNKTMKKIIVYIRLNLIKIIFGLILLAAIIAVWLFTAYCLKNYWAVESFSRKTIAAQMAMMMPMFVITYLISTPIMIGLQYYFLQGGFANLGKESFSLSSAKVKWSDVIGLEEAKKDAQELIELLKDRKKLKRAGGKIIKGMLMMGPPGCGKTYLAKAVATECGLPMISATGSEFVGIFIGVGTARIKNLFKKARAMAELHGGCLIFIDEIDSFARPRQADRGFGGTMDHNATINQFLTEMDGLRKTENTIVVLAATNCEDYELDQAIVRPGRLERKINVTLPNLKEREQIFALYLNKVVYNKETIDLKVLARKTVWFSPAESESMVREASLLSMRNHHQQIEREDINDAYDRVSFGHKSNAVQPEKDKLWTAYHEAGHALLSYLLASEHDVMKATIIPRQGALGFVFFRPKEEKYKETKEDLLISIKISVASYVAEKKKFGSTSSGVGGHYSADFGHAMRDAQRMVWSLGMGPSGLIGDFSIFSQGYGFWSSGTPLSEETKAKLNNDTQQILQECLKDTEAIIERNWDALEHFAQQLYIKEELDYDEIEQIFTKFGITRTALLTRDVPDALALAKTKFQQETTEKKAALAAAYKAQNEMPVPHPKK